MREREVRTFWNELTAEEQQEWENFEEYREKDFSEWPDQDFEAIE